MSETWRHNTAARDLTDAERVKDARHELRRASDVAALAEWARKWGEPCIAALATQEDHTAEVEAANEEATEAEEELDRFKGRCADASQQLEDVSDLIEEGKKDAAIRLVNEIQNLLEAA